MLYRYFPPGKVKELEKKLTNTDYRQIERLRKEADLLINEIREFDYLIENYEPFRKEATDRAIEVLLKNAYDLSITTIKNAVVASKEFNYEPYIRQLIISFSAKIGEIITVNRDSGRVNVDFSPLGDKSMWIQAIAATRTLHKWGKSKGQPRTTTLYDDVEPGEGDLASLFWRYKIYGAGREGRKVVKKRYSKRQKKVITKDVTHKYKDKYYATVINRLAMINPNSAPFWEIINDGNIGWTSDASGGGVAYPVVHPTRFVDQLRRKLNIYLNKLITMYTDIVEEELKQNELRYSEVQIEKLDQAQKTVLEELAKAIENGTVDSQAADFRKRRMAVDVASKKVEGYIVGKNLNPVTRYRNLKGQWSTR